MFASFPTKPDGSPACKVQGRLTSTGPPLAFTNNTLKADHLTLATQDGAHRITIRSGPTLAPFSLAAYPSCGLAASCG